MLAKRGCREVHETGGGSGREHITVLGAASASGTRLPPYVVYKAKHLYDTWTKGGPAGALFNKSPSGWMEQPHFLEWFKKMFLPSVQHLLSTGAVVLFFDGHYSHISIDLIRSAQSNRVHLLCFPSQATAVLQPLDVGVFGPLKQAWKKVLKEHKIQSNVDKEVFPTLLAQLWSRSFTKQHLQSGFKATGLFPLDRDAIPESRLAVSSIYQQSTPEDPVSPPHRARTLHPSPTPELHLHLKAHFTVILQEKKPSKSKRRRCELRVYGEALTSDEVLQRIEENEAQKAEKRRGKRRRRKEEEEVSGESDHEGVIYMILCANYMSTHQSFHRGAS